MKKLICFVTAALLLAMMVSCDPKKEDSFETRTNDAQTTQGQATQENDQTTQENDQTTEENTTTENDANNENGWTNLY